jgi:hypothetical protein
MFLTDLQRETKWADLPSSQPHGPNILSLYLLEQCLFSAQTMISPVSHSSRSCESVLIKIYISIFIIHSDMPV